MGERRKYIRIESKFNRRFTNIFKQWIICDRQRSIYRGIFTWSNKKQQWSINLEESDKSYFEIEEIYIHPDFRGKGFGKALLKEVTENLNKQGIDRMTVSSANKDWKKIIDFYQMNGFKTWTMTLFK